MLYYSFKYMLIFLYFNTYNKIRQNREKYFIFITFIYAHFVLHVLFTYSFTFVSVPVLMIDPVRLFVFYFENIRMWKGQDDDPSQILWSVFSDFRDVSPRSHILILLFFILTNVLASNLQISFSLCVNTHHDKSRVD